MSDLLAGFGTLKQPIEIAGIGLHCGRQVALQIRPDERAGWHFRRLDLPGAPEIKASLENVVATQHATVLEQNSARVSTTEHLLAALWSAGITHARIELDGEEVPIRDGSAQDWAESIARAGREVVDGERPVWGLQQSVWHESSGANLLGVAHDAFRLSVAVDFGVAHAGAQTVDLLVDERSFRRELAPARTFTLAAWLEPLRGAGLIRGGSLENAILIDPSGPSSPFRFPNELARHKALDAIGDLALLFSDGGAFRGHLVAVRAGHGAHRSWMEACCHSQALVRI